MKGLVKFTVAVTGILFMVAASASTDTDPDPNAAMNASPDTENVLDRVKETLLDRMGEEATGINVAVANGQVALSGCVDSEAQHDRAARVARDVEDVTRLYVDELEVCQLTSAAR